MSAAGRDKNQVSSAKRGAWVALGVVLLVLVVGGALRFPPVLIVLWSLGEVVIPVWEAIDPTEPRLPTLPNDMAGPKDADAKGKALRTTIDRLYASAPETRKSWLRDVLAPPYVGPKATDISRIVQHYIPVGTSFDEAERILRTAGMTIVFPRTTQSERTLPASRWRDYDVKAELMQYTRDPPGYMRLYVSVPPQSSHDYEDSQVGKVTATLSKQIGAPTPPVSLPFDVSKESAVVEATIKITKEKYYQFDLMFRGTRLADMAAISKLAGDTYLGEAFADKRSGPGLAVPVHVVVKDDRQQVLYDRTIDTRGHYAYGTLTVLRRAGGLHLGPGIYYVRASTTKSTPELDGTKVEFSVTYDARL